MHTTNENLSVDMTITIIEAQSYQSHYAAAVQRLTNQLTSHPVEINEASWIQMLSRDDSHLFLLLVDEEVAGMISVGIYFSPTGGKAWIEDVVVDEVYRGRGLSKCLVEHAIIFAREAGVHTLMLTSRPARIAANHLYRSMGFVQRETNVYKLEL